MKPFAIQPLTIQRLEEAIELVTQTFPYEQPADIRLAIASSVQADLHAERLRKWDCNWDTYWITIEADQVQGIIGLYTFSSDEKTTDWLGWFAVRPSFRGRGLGAQLLKHAIKVATQRGKKKLRLYTSTDPNEAQAHVLYRKNSFTQYASEKTAAGSETLYFERIL